MIACIIIDFILESKIKHSQSLGERLKILHAHDALCLLQHALALPKVLYICLEDSSMLSIRALKDFSPTFHFVVHNNTLNNTSWLQASLPRNHGGLGIRSAAMLVPSAFLSSAAGCSPLLPSLLPQDIVPTAHTIRQEALQVWQDSTNETPPSGRDALKQKSWDLPIVEVTFTFLVQSVDAKARARLLAAHEKESCLLSAAPVSVIGLRMDDESIRVATGLQRGSSLCVRHSCKNRGSPVDESGTHGLSYRKGQGCIPRHSGLNHLIQKALMSTQVPVTLEPCGLYRSDGRRPDGLSLIPWSHGRALVWDATCRDTYAPSYLQHSSTKAGAVVDEAAAQKCRLYAQLCTTHCFVPLLLKHQGFSTRNHYTFSGTWPLEYASKIMIHLHT